MKQLLGVAVCACVAIALSFGVTGCTKKPPVTTATPPVTTPAKPPTTTTATTPVTTPATTPVKTPTTPTKKMDVTMTVEDKATVKPGETKVVKLKLTRQADAKNEVEFTVEVAPKEKGVTATVDKVAMDSSEGSLKIVASDKAEPGEYIVKVSGTSKDSAALAAATVTVTVAKKEAEKEKTPVVVQKKDKLEVVADAKELKLKQGEKKDVKVSVTMGADLTKATVATAVKDDKAKESKALKVTLAPADLAKTGESIVTVDVPGDAPVGEYWVVITTASVGGTPAAMIETKIKVTVVAK